MEQAEPGPGFPPRQRLVRAESDITALIFFSHFAARRL